MSWASLIPSPPREMGRVIELHFFKCSLFLPQFFFPHQKSLCMVLIVVLMVLGKANVDIRCIGMEEVTDLMRVVLPT